MTLRRHAIVLAGVLLGVSFLFMAGRSLDLALVGETLRHAHAADLIGVVACAVLFLLVKAIRWRYLLRPLAHASTADLLPAVFAGNAGNLIVPHAGEIARAIVANRRLKVPTSALLASIAVERFFDFLALLMIALAALIPVGRMSPNLMAASYVLGALVVLILGAAAAFIVWTENCLRFVEWTLAPASASAREGVLRHVRAGTAGLHAIGQPGLFLTIFLLSLLHWTVVIGCITFSIASVGLSISLAAAVSVLVLGVIGLMLPAAPGHVGTVQLAFTVALGQFGIAQSDAFAAAVIYNFLVVVTGFVLGLPSLRMAGMELRRLLSVKDQLERRP